MTAGVLDDRTPQQRARDEVIAAEPPLAPPDLLADTIPRPLEAHLGTTRRPVAVAGIVEGGVVRPVDPAVRLTERSRVIIVATEPA